MQILQSSLSLWICCTVRKQTTSSTFMQLTHWTICFCKSSKLFSSWLQAQDKFFQTMRMHFHIPQATSETQHCQQNKPLNHWTPHTFHLILLITILAGGGLAKFPQGTGFTQMSVVFFQWLEDDPKRNITGTGVREVSWKKLVKTPKICHKGKQILLQCFGWKLYTGAELTPSSVAEAKDLKAII